MTEHPTDASTTEGLPVSPSLGPTLEAAQVGPHPTVDSRVVYLSTIAVGLGLVAGGVARVLGALINLVTNLAFYQRFSLDRVGPEHHELGWLVILVPVVGGVIVGLMARYGSKAIRGHGIPEAMEQVLTNESRIPPRITFLKPLSAAISIGTGGPFGAEGPIIATGGALGSVVGQLLPTTAAERKALLAAGAAAGMAATFASPVSAVLLAVELLLFEYRPRSLLPVAMATVTATAVRLAWAGSEPVFPMPEVLAPGAEALAAYVAIGLIAGVVSVGVTRAVYGIEDLFEKLPIHWMWWPAIGGLAVGLVGLVAPKTMGVGYTNIEDLVNGRLVLGAVVSLTVWKFVSWSISLGSGTSGGTLAPLLTLGGGLGAVLGWAGTQLFPSAHIDVHVAALVGMAALFAGASRALLASMVFAFETTRQPLALMPLLAGCAVAFLVSSLLMRQSIMTEKIARRGVKVLGEYGVDLLEQQHVRDFASRTLVTLAAADALDEVRSWMAGGAAGSTHQGFPVVDAAGALVGVVTRRDLLSATGGTVGELVKRAPITVREGDSLRTAVNTMLRASVGRLAVVDDGGKLVGMLTRSDVLAAHMRRLEEHRRSEPTLTVPVPFRRPA